jgi:hypothetical protein
MMRKNFLVLTLTTTIAGISFAQVPMPAQTVPAAPVQAHPPQPTISHPPTQPTTTTTQPSNPVKTPAQPPQPAIPPPAQPLTPQEMQQLNQLVPPITGTPSNTPPTTGLPSLPGSVMSKRDRVKNYEVLQRVGNIYVVSSPNNHTYVIRSDSQILRRYKCHIEYPYTFCENKHKKTHIPKHGSY